MATKYVFNPSHYQNTTMKYLDMPDGIGFINIEQKTAHYFSMVLKYPLKEIHCFEMPELYDKICNYITDKYDQCEFPSRQFGYNPDSENALTYMIQINCYINGDSLDSICHQIEQIIYDNYTISTNT
jgi:hypothetical protein